MAQTALFLALGICLALASSASATCSNTVCPRLTEFETDNCLSCEKAYKVANADPENGICCKEFACKPDPDQPCCGRVCPTEEEELERCNTFAPENPTLNSILPQTGTRSVVMRREAKPDKGKCCPDYECVINYEALCANITANQPCPNNGDCGLCQVAQITSPASPETGKCCPDFVCVEDPQCLCDERTITNCPEPTCDDELEFPVIVEEADPSKGCCCPQYSCERNNTAICAAKNAFNNYTGPSCPQCEVPLVLREPDVSRLRCEDEWACVPDLTDLCCGFDNSTCAGIPECGEFEYVNLTLPADPFTARCCDEYRCFKNWTAVCNALPCPYADANDYQSVKCPNPPGRDWYFIETTPEDVPSGKCCPDYRCRETIEKQIHDLENKASRRRRRRS